MLGDSSTTVLATGPSGGGGGGGGGSGEPPAPPPSGEVGHAGSNNISSNNNNNSSVEEDLLRGGRGGGGGGDEGDRSFGGNRWPRQETLALLKIRSYMDVAFRDASVKGPLWEEVSRKLAELGYNRSSKKCKEKFENVYKYHKRTKEGRTGKQEGKTYRFFDQLEAFDHLSHSSSLPSPTHPPPQPSPLTKPPAAVVNTIPMPLANAAPPPPPPPPTGASHITVPPTTITATIGTFIPQGNSVAATAAAPTVSISIPSFPPTNPTTLPPPSTKPTNPISIPSSFITFSPDLMSDSTSSSTSSDVEIQGRRKRKRKWRDLFERLMKDVIHKQEEMQRKFLEAIEKREHERMAREESWRMQEMERINREREILAHERSMAAAKDTAVMAFLQKLSEQQNPGQPVQTNNQPQPQQQPNPPPPLQSISVIQPPKPAPPQQAVAPVPLPQQPVTTTNMEIVMKSDNGDQNFMPPSSSRWPKVEVEALIRMRTNLDSKYEENGPKGPLWEEISGGMRKLGYNRSAKRCKEKWENINKYFKKVKESNKKRPEDSKTCPYFHQLDALYKEKNKIDHQFKPENSVPFMVMPEQQWPPAPQDHRPDSAMDDMDSEEHQNDDDKDDDDEDEAGGYEIVASKSAALMSTAE